MREVEKMTEEIGRRRSEWRRHKAHLEEVGRWMSDVLEDAEYRLDRVLRRCKGVSGTDGGSGAEEEKGRHEEIPAGIFREIKDERERTWVHSILRVCSPAAGEQMEVREVVELLAEHHKMSRDTLRGNVMSVLLDEAIGKRGAVKFVKGLKRR